MKHQALAKALQIHDAFAASDDTYGMHNRHPDLDINALDAIAWKFTFDWR